MAVYWTLVQYEVNRALDQMWSRDSAGDRPSAPAAAGGEILYDKIQGLAPKSDAQRSLQGQALSMAMDIGKTRWLMYGCQFACLRPVGFRRNLSDPGDVHALYRGD